MGIGQDIAASLQAATGIKQAVDVFSPQPLWDQGFLGQTTPGTQQAFDLAGGFRPPGFVDPNFRGPPQASEVDVLGNALRTVGQDFVSGDPVFDVQPGEIGLAEMGGVTLPQITLPPLPGMTAPQATGALIAPTPEIEVPDINEAVTAEYWKTAVADPMLREFDEVVAPRIRESYAATGAFFSTQHGDATRKALESLQDDLTSDLALTQISNQQLLAKLQADAFIKGAELASNENINQAIIDTGVNTLNAEILTELEIAAQENWLEHAIAQGEINLKTAAEQAGFDWNTMATNATFSHNRNIAAADLEFKEKGLEANLAIDASNRKLTGLDLLQSLENLPFERIMQMFQVAQPEQSRVDFQQQQEYADWVRSLGRGDQLSQALIGNAGDFLTQQRDFAQQREANRTSFSDYAAVGLGTAGAALTGGIAAPALLGVSPLMGGLAGGFTGAGAALGAL